jgi:uncharacterized protein (DUF433 family)
MNKTAAARLGKVRRLPCVVVVEMMRGASVNRFTEFSQHASTKGGQVTVKWKRLTERRSTSMTTVDFAPLTVAVPLWEDPPGVFRVGNTRVLLELVLRAFKRGESPEGIVRSYRTLLLADVYAVISRYLANPTPFDEYLRLCEEQAESVRRQIEASLPAAPTKEALLTRARQRAHSLIAFLVDQKRQHADRPGNR